MAEEKEVKQEKKTYTYQDLIKFSNLDVYSGFGEVKESNKPSAPKFSFGTSTRDAEPKKFTNKETAWIDCFGMALIMQASRRLRAPTTMFMTSFCILKAQSSRLAPSLGILWTRRPSTSTTSAKTSM